MIYDGVALEGVDVAIGNGTPDGGRTGEILLRGPMLLRCYRDGTDPCVAGADGAGWLPPATGARWPPTGGWSCSGDWTR